MNEPSVFATQTMPTPVGPLTLLAYAGVLYGAGFTADARLAQERLALRWRGTPLAPVDDLGSISAMFTAYFDGDLQALDGVRVAQEGGPFAQAAWDAMRGVPAGQTITYQQLAARAGNAAAVRAAGSACARNAIAPVVPCHRILRVGGALGGYRWGLEVKRWLLSHERGERPVALAGAERHNGDAVAAVVGSRRGV